MRTFKILWPFIWRKDTKTHFVTSIFITFAVIAANIGTLLALKHIIDLFSESVATPQSYILILLTTYALLWVLGHIGNEIRSYIVVQALERSINHFGLNVFDHLLRLSSRFHSQRQTGEITHAIEKAQRSFDDIFWGFFLFMLPTLSEIICALIVLWYFYGFLYSALLIIILLGYMLLTMFGMKWSGHAQDTYIKKSTQVAGRIVDSLLNFETIKIFNNEQFEHTECTHLIEKKEAAAHKKNFTATVIAIIQETIIGLGIFIVTAITGILVIQKKLTPGDFILINTYLIQFATPLNYLSYIIQQMHRGLRDIQQVLSLLHFKPEITDAPHALNFDTIDMSNAEVRFNNVSFIYSDRDILNNISLTIPAGTTTAFVGSTGAGKSTIFRLLFRFYDVTQGSITINGHDIRSVTQASLHTLIGVVPQDTVLFNNTIAYNIAYGNPLATQEEIERAAHLAHLDSSLKTMAEGYNTKVGERGLRLSGGEKQRIAIARVILKNPKILIFDEATSALDTKTEKSIQANLDEISKNRTTIIIAHRLSTITHADQIIVLDKGTIAERGTHQELIERHGLYYDLWHKQQANNN
jgi:ATP-binding cassette subfamily B protein